MKYHAMSDEALLQALIGHEAAAAYRGSLRQLFAAEDGPEPDLTPLYIARELVERLLLENVKTGSVLESPKAVRDYLTLRFQGLTHESFVTVYLDAQHRLIVAEESFRGTLTQTAVYPREIVRRALVVNAAAVIFAHNHPSGSAEPSRADEHLTATLKTALSLVDVRVLDHFVIGGACATSFAERGLL